MSNNITVEHIAQVRKYFSCQSVADFLAGKKTYGWFRAVHKEFLTRSNVDDKIANAFSGFGGTIDMHKLVGKVARRLPRYYGMDKFNIWDREEMYFSLSHTIVNGLVACGIVSEVDEPHFEIRRGRRIQIFVRKIVFDGKFDEYHDLTRGISNEPGKVISKFIRSKPGCPSLRVSGKAKEAAKMMSSRPLCFIDIARDELVDEYMKKDNWYTVKSKFDDPIFKDERVEKYADMYLSLVGSEFYLTRKFDSRMRNYYDFNNVAFGPQSKYGKYFYQLPEDQAEIINEFGYSKLCHAALKFSGFGKISIAKSIAKYEKNQDVVRERMASDNYALNLYYKRIMEAIDDYHAGRPSRFMLGMDLTDGGLQRFGLAFHSVKAMKASNVGGLKTYQDSHNVIAEKFGVTRDETKEIIMSVKHGGSIGSFVEYVKTIAGKEITVEEARYLLADSFGDEIMYINEINQYCRDLYDNYNTYLQATTPDGLKMISSAYVSQVKRNVYGLDLKNKKMYSSIKIESDMPYYISSDGDQVYENTKVSGSFANLTHAIDGVHPRDVGSALSLVGASWKQYHKYSSHRSAIFWRGEVRNWWFGSCIYSSYKQSIGYI